MTRFKPQPPVNLSPLSLTGRQPRRDPAGQLSNSRPSSSRRSGEALRRPLRLAMGLTLGLLVSSASLLVLGCAPSMRSVGPSLQHHTGAQADLNAQAILQALTRLRYQVVSHTPPTIVAMYRHRAQAFRVRIDYGDGGYQVSLVDSNGMNQGTDPRTGTMMISGRYHRYVSKLEIWIGRMLERGGASDTGSGGTAVANERSIQLNYPTTLGTVERGLVLAGFEVETRRDDAGFITTTFVDSGQGYGQVDGDDATVHQRFTVVLSSNQVRVRMDLRKCATGGVFITSNLGRAAVTGRCESMDLPADRGLRGVVRRQLVEPFDRLFRAIEREIQTEPAPEAPAQLPSGPMSDTPIVDA